MIGPSIEEQNAQSIKKLQELMSFNEHDRAIEASATEVCIFTSEEEQELDQRLESIARAQAFAVGSLQNLVLG